MDAVCAQANDVGRKLVTFPESVWGDFFLKVSPNEEKLDSWRRRANELKEKVLDMLSCAKGTEQVHLIDALYHLGISYQFEKEIEDALVDMSNTYTRDSSKDDLYSLGLRFRLLRHNGFNASAHAFSKFKDARGGFKEDLASDVKALLSLYEASYAGTMDDFILDEALAFTKKHLKAALPRLDSNLAKRVSNSLELPLHKRIQRLEARDFIDLCEKGDESMFKELLEFAKLDYNILQALHQWELKELTKWWKKLNLVGKMTFARDRVTEIYFYVSGCFFEPQYSRGRIFTSKILAICSVVDDEYDVYGTMDELQVFTGAICRWDIVAAMETLPEYVKPLYEAIFYCLKEFEDELAREGNAYRVKYLVEQMKNLCKSYLQETKWLHQRYIPTLEEYLHVSEISSVYGVISTACFVGCGEIATNEAFEWLKGFPKLLKDSGRVGRITDDIMSCKFEQSRGHCPSAVECYIKEHQCSNEVAVESLRGVLERAWRDMNKACMRPTPFSMEILKPIVNLARIAEIIYQYEDGYTFSGGKTKERISVLFKDPIPI